MYFQKNNIDISWTGAKLDFKCDLVEFQCLISNDKRYSFGEYSDEVEDENRLFYFNDSTDVPLEDSVASEFLSLRNHLVSRKERFEDFYPFEISESSSALILIDDYDNLSFNRKLYLILLVSSVFTLADRSSIVRLGYLFERLSKFIVEVLVPTSFEVQIFGSGGESNELYFGKLRTKIERLAENLKIETETRMPEIVNEKNYGDGGIDLVAYNNNIFQTESQQLFFFAQCACGENWIDKQYDCYYGKWSKLLNFDTYPVSLFITPKSLRTDDWKFSQYGDIASHNVFIDRIIITKLLNNLSEYKADEIMRLYQPVFQNLVEVE